jgi:hypothetical protein
MFSIQAKIHLIPTGGRKTPIHSGYRCPAHIGNEHWDCLLTFEGEIAPGQTKSGVTIQFLSPEVVREKLSKGSVFYLTEGKIVGSVQVESLSD